MQTLRFLCALAWMPLALAWAALARAAAAPVYPDHAAPRGQPLADALHVKVTGHGGRVEGLTVGIGDTFALVGVPWAGGVWKVVSHDPGWIYPWALRSGDVVRFASAAELLDPAGQWQRVEVTSPKEGA